MSYPKFSVVIPLYNKKEHISRAVRSVLAQKCPDFELIVVDDGSADGGGDVVRGVSDPRIILIRQDNTGVSAARNRGVEESRGCLIAFLDADDEWAPDFLDTILRLREMHHGAGIYATAYEIVAPDGKRTSPIYCEIPPAPWEGILPSYFKAAAHGAPPVCASAVCIPKKVIVDAGLFSVGKRMGEDLDLWGRVALRHPVAFSWRIGAVYHQDASNRACTRFSLQDEHPFIETAALLTDCEVCADSLVNLQLYVARLRLENARQHVLAGNFQRARQLLSVRYASPSWFRRFIWGTHINRLTFVVWKLKAKILGYKSENY